MVVLGGPACGEKSLDRNSEKEGAPSLATAIEVDAEEQSLDPNSEKEGAPSLATGIEVGVEAPTLRSRVLKDMRALAISVDERSLFGGRLGKEHHVDILCTVPELQEVGSRKTVTLLQNVTVLAVDGPQGTGPSHAGGHSVEDRRSTGSVTVQVTPEEAELLVFAQDYGTLALSLRGEGDVNTDHTLEGKRARDIFVGPKTVKKTPPCTRGRSPVPPKEGTKRRRRR